MPIYSGSTALQNDEWILLQIKEGPCSAGCDYCYENSHIRSVLGAGQAAGIVEEASLGELSTLQLAQLTEKYRERLGTEMSIDEVRRIFRLLRQSGIRRAGLIGSEPTSHTKFGEILDIALEQEVELLVYTAGLSPRLLQHSAIRYVVLHLDYGRLGVDELARRSELGVLPSASYMRHVEDLLADNKEVHLRVNFSSLELLEARMVKNFFRQIPGNLRKGARLKYSFNTRVNGDATVDYETPESLRLGSSVILKFFDDFCSEFPEVKLISERPLFQCSFDQRDWEKYSDKAGLLSSCDMEYTFYPNTGLALCPPSRALTPSRQISTTSDLHDHLTELRSQLEAMYRVSSFECCEDCSLRLNLSCQGGCLGYKVGQRENRPSFTEHVIPISSLALNSKTVRRTDASSDVS